MNGFTRKHHHSPSPPNLFEFATKELAQDAALAYMLSWAHPHFKNSHSNLHRLGTDLLHSLLEKTNAAKSLEVSCIEVELQYKKIDLLVKINEFDEESPELAIVIEDKVNTDEHSDQITRYTDIAKKRYSCKGTEIVAVLLKTGNTSRVGMADHEKGVFLRDDLLAVLNQHETIEDTIVINFHEYLRRLEEITNSYLQIKVDDWHNHDWKIYEGFFNRLESLMEKDKWWENRGSWGWRYVSNPQGGFMCMPFAGFKPIFQSQPTAVYPQIECGHSVRLTLRLGRWDDGQEKVDSKLMWHCWELTEQLKDSLPEFEVEKAGRFRGGGFGAVACFKDFIAQKNDGIVDMEITMDNLRKIAVFTEKISEKLGEDTK